MKKLFVLVICSFLTLPVFAQSDYKGFLAFYGGTSFTTQLNNLNEVFTLSYGGLVSRRSYVGSFEIMGKAFTRENIPLSLGFKYAYSFTGSGDFELGLDLSAFVQADRSGSSTEMAAGNELGLFVIKFIANKVSIGIRSGYYVKNFNIPNGFLYLEGVIKWYFL